MKNTPTTGRTKVVAPVLLLTAMLGGGCGLGDTITARRLARQANQHYRNSEYLKAIELYEKAIELDPDTPNVYLNLGYSYFSIYNPNSKNELKRGAAAKAVEAFAEHLKRNPDDDDTRTFQIKTMLTAAPDNPEIADRAQRLFVEMLRKNPEDHEARQYLISLFIDCKRYAEAVEYFSRDLARNPHDFKTMKILAIIADKSGNTQQAVEWYWKRAEAAEEPEKRAAFFYEIGTWAWNLLHYQPDRLKGAEAIKLADQGIRACYTAMDLKQDYAEAMVYANLLYLKRALYETEEIARVWDNEIALELRTQAGKILKQRKMQKGKENEKT